MHALVVELADTHALGACNVSCTGSSPVEGTKKIVCIFQEYLG